jgi:hypothetical protein
MGFAIEIGHAFDVTLNPSYDGLAPFLFLG